MIKAIDTSITWTAMFRIVTHERLTYLAVKLKFRFIEKLPVKFDWNFLIYPFSLDSLYSLMVGSVGILEVALAAKYITNRKVTLYKIPKTLQITSE